VRRKLPQRGLGESQRHTHCGECESALGLWSMLHDNVIGSHVNYEKPAKQQKTIEQLNEAARSNQNAINRL
jgi:hypothetical protein